MIQYEYKVIETKLDPEAEEFINLLNELGKDRWELVTVERFVRDSESVDIPNAVRKLLPTRFWLLFLIRRKNI